ncbi:unnamed protein product [Caenorhabditis sp. 36 PRJEB53466]|nr:unnamed protein product [Caenorhabditis sp. 36 PRJEB53466]
MRVVKPAFSRPRPKINSIDDRIRTDSQKTNQGNIIKTSIVPKIRTTLVTAAPRRLPHAILQPPRSPALPQPKGEKIFIMQVTASPTMRPEVPRISSTATTKSSFERTIASEADGGSVLAQITSQINGGMSPELLAKIETIIKSEMQNINGTDWTIPRKLSIFDLGDKALSTPEEGFSSFKKQVANATRGRLDINFDELKAIGKTGSFPRC